MRDNDLFPLIILFTLLVCSTTIKAHDTTHIHPLITSKIGGLIKLTDAIEQSYLDIYKEDDQTKERIYWGTDDDAGMGELTQDYLMDDQHTTYNDYNNVIDGVVQEDVPGGKVLDHFYHALSGNPLKVPLAKENSAKRAMRFFNESIERMGGYTEDAKHTAFFEFGQALHHVEDMITPAHIHNDVENVLFTPILRYGQLKNTHVANSTLRFLNSPCLALKQTDSFSGVDV